VSERASDRFLNGRVLVQQPATGFRAGLDAVMLAAAVPARRGDRVLELGSGAGTASLCLASLVECSVTGVEVDRALVSLSRRNAKANGYATRVRFIEADALENPREIRTEFEHVFANPPFHSTAITSPNAQRARATHDRSGFGPWIEAGLHRTRSGGTLTMILRADRLQEFLVFAPAGGLCVFPLWPRTGRGAKRVIVQMRKGRRHALNLLPGLILHSSSGKYTEEADAVLRGKSRLDVSPDSS